MPAAFRLCKAAQREMSLYGNEDFLQQLQSALLSTPEMREKIRQVMRFSGPRMLLYHPALALWHVACSVWEKRKQRERMGKPG